MYLLTDFILHFFYAQMIDKLEFVHILYTAQFFPTNKLGSSLHLGPPNTTHK